MARVFTTIATLAAAGAGDSFDLRPPVGEDWEVTGFTGSVFSGGTVPQVDAGLVDATTGVMTWMRHSGNTGTFENLAGWAGQTRLFINHDCWLRVENADAAGTVVGISAKIAGKYPVNGTSKVVSGTVTSAVPVVIRPPVGEDWLLTHVGCSVWAGANPNQLPATHIDITDGVITATVANDTIASRGWDTPLDIYMNHDNYVVLTPAGACTLSWSAIKIKEYGPQGVSDVITQVGTIPVATFLDFQPVAGEEWIVTQIGCNAAFTAGIPTVQVDLRDTALQTTIAQVSTANKGWFDEMRYYLNHDNWLRLTAVAADVVGISGYKWRE
jgi:hypothetical protein